MNIAIVIFAYNRLEHLRECLAKLEISIGDLDLPVYVYSDGPKGPPDVESVEAIRKLLSEQNSRFNLTPIFRPFNYGLSKNIKDGLSDIFTDFDAAIIIEDDILLSPVAISYFVAALKYYEDYDNVFHINGWKHPNLPQSEICSLTEFMSCWGWATWSTKWLEYSDAISDELNRMSVSERYELDRRGSGYFWSQLVRNSTGRLDTWAIYWYSIIKLRRAMCVSPPYPLVSNNGFDGSGQNCKVSEVASDNRINLANLQKPADGWAFQKSVELDRTMEKEIDQFYRLQHKNILWYYCKKCVTFLSYFKSL